MIEFINSTVSPQEALMGLNALATVLFCYICAVDF